MVMATAQEVEILKRQLDELTAQMIEIRQQSSSTVTNAAEAVRTMGQSVSKPRPEDMRVGKPEPFASVKNSDDWYFTFNPYAGTLPAYPAMLKNSETITNSAGGDSTTRTAVCNLAIPTRWSRRKEHGKS